MDKCREEFEAIAKELDLDCEWVDLTGITVFDGASGKKKDGCYNDFTTDTAWGFYRIQQAKVEELQNLYTQQGINMLKLQKRVDAVEQVISKVRNGNYSSDQGECVANFIACMLEQALKGGNND